MGEQCNPELHQDGLGQVMSGNNRSPEMGQDVARRASTGLHVVHGKAAGHDGQALIADQIEIEL